MIAESSFAVRDDKLIALLGGKYAEGVRARLKLTINDKQVVSFVPQLTVLVGPNKIEAAGCVFDGPSLLKFAALHCGISIAEDLVLRMTDDVTGDAVPSLELNLAAQIADEWVYDGKRLGSIELTRAREDALAGWVSLPTRIAAIASDTIFAVSVNGTSLHDLSLRSIPVDGNWSFDVAMPHGGNRLRSGDIVHLYHYQSGIIVGVTRLPDIQKLSQLIFDQFSGQFASGWASVHGNSAKRIMCTVDSVDIGWIPSAGARPDVKEALGIKGDKLGFLQDFGGLLHFAAANRMRDALSLSLSEIEATAAVLSDTSEALKFAPMRLSLSDREDGFPFMLTSFKCHGESAVDVEFSVSNGQRPVGCRVQAFQIDESGKFKQLGDLRIDSNASAARLRFNAFDLHAPLLLLATSLASGQYLASDCIPMPALAHISNMAMVEIHGLFSRGKTRLQALRALQKNWLGYLIHEAAPALLSMTKTASLVASRANTVAIVFARDEEGLLDLTVLPALQNVAQRVLTVRGGHITNDSGKNSFPSNLARSAKPRKGLATLADELDAIDAEYFAITEKHSAIRPDFWAVLRQSLPMAAAEIVTGNSITFDGNSRPLYISHKPITNLIQLAGEPLVPVNFLLVRKTILLKLLAQTPVGQLPPPEHILLESASAKNEHLRMPLYVHTEQPLLDKENKTLISHSYEPTRSSSVENVSARRKVGRRSVSRVSGISVVLRFSSTATAVLSTLNALRLQKFTGPIEVLLVSNGVREDQINVVLAHARNLFGDSNVTVVNTPYAFEPDRQINAAVSVAREPLLFFLDAGNLMLTPGSLELGASVISNEAIGSCGFRLIQPSGVGDWRLKSVGLNFALGRIAGMGGSLLENNVVPNRLFDSAIRVAGNTFSAAFIRKNTFLEIVSTESIEMLGTLNEVDFCLSAAARGLSHIALGRCVIQLDHALDHDTDLQPLSDSVRLRSLRNADELAQTFSVYAYGDMRVY